MAFNVNEFVSEINTLGNVRTSHFEVRITRPDCLSSYDTPNVVEMANMEAKFRFLCESTTIPGVSVALSENRPQGYGPIRRYPNTPIYSEWTGSFVVDSKASIVRFFQLWFQGITNVNSSSNYLSSYKDAIGPEFQYKDFYKANIDLLVFNEAQDQIIKYTLVNAFPSVIGDVPVAWQNNDEIMRLPVSFVYDYWTSDLMAVPAISGTRGAGFGGFSGLSGLQKLVRVGTAVQAIVSGGFPPRNVADALNVVNNAKLVTSLF